MRSGVQLPRLPGGGVQIVVVGQDGASFPLRTYGVLTVAAWADVLQALKAFVRRAFSV